MKRKLLVLLGVLLLAASSAVQAQFTCITNADNTLTITGYAGPPWDVTIPNSINGLTVSRIGVNAFANLSSLTSVTALGGVTSIAQSAFSLCASLISITIPKSVISIGNYVFYKCTSLTSITIPGNVSSIGEQAFYECTSLYSVAVGNGVTNIGADAFQYCSSLTRLTISNGVTSIGESAFWGCNSLTNVTIPDSVTNISDDAFFGCANLTNITIGKGIAYVGEFALGSSTSLTSVYFTGNAPVANTPVYYGAMTAYYLPNTTGWGPTLCCPVDVGGVPTVLWDPLIQTIGANFGVRSYQFGFNITGTNNFTVVVEVCTNLANPVWTPLQTVTLTNGSYYFSDPQWTNYPARFYGLGVP